MPKKSEISYRIGIFILLSIIETTDILGQESMTTIGVGVLVGRVSGVTMKVRTPFEEGREVAFYSRGADVNLSTNFDDFLLWSAHLLFESDVPNSPLTSYIGPGMMAGFKGRTVFWGPSASLGVYFTKARYEVFLQAMPRLQMKPGLDGRIESAVGLRIYL